MNFLPEEIAKYAEQFSSPEDALLAQLNRETHIKTLFPRMISGKMQGQLLRFFSQMIRPEHILEIGTFTAYATICLAGGLLPGGSMDTIDINEELEDIIVKYLRLANIEKQVNVHFGNALNIIPQLSVMYDLVFIDADKENYAAYYQLCFDKVKKGGFIIADNVLWSGKVIDPDARDKDTLALRAFNELVLRDERVENLLLPFRDGLMIVRKK